MPERFEDSPVFIGGCGRSGTTMLGDMLGAHPQLLTLPEADFIAEGLRRTAPGPDRPEKMRRLARGHYMFRALLSDSAHLAYAGCADRYAGITARIVTEYAGLVGGDTAERFVDQTPKTMQYAASLRAAFNGAKFLHVVRDGRAVAASFLRVDWGPNEAMLAARFWLERLSYGLACELAFPSDIIMRVRYEDLVAEPELEMRRICSFLGLDFDAAMLRGGGLDNRVVFQSSHRLVGAPPDRRRLDGWRKALSPRDIELFEWVAGDMLKHLGYRPDTDGRAVRRPSTAERGTRYLRHLRIKSVNLIRGNLRFAFAARRRANKFDRQAGT